MNKSSLGELFPRDHGLLRPAKVKRHAPWLVASWINLQRVLPLESEVCSADDEDALAQPAEFKFPDEPPTSAR